MKFNQTLLCEQLLKAVIDAGYTDMSPIQEKTIPAAIDGKDILGCAQTGSGKTAAFTLPILQQINQNNPSGHNVNKKIRALIMTPTRELAIQIQDNINAYSKYLNIKGGVIFGGVSQKPQVDMLNKGVSILVATPGRLKDLMDQGYISLDGIETFVLDEADRMLDMGFLPEIKRIIAKLPAKRQTLLFSATMPDEIGKIANRLLTNPVVVKVEANHRTVDSIAQCLFYVDKANKVSLLASLIKSEKIADAIVFTNTKYGADKVAKKLNKMGITAEAIHGDKGQNTRQRALNDFKEGNITVLVATDIAARGIDIAGLSYVFNYDLPNAAEDYVHRIGRTGRAGKSGMAINFCCFKEIKNLRQIEKFIGFKIEEKECEFPMEILEEEEPQKRPERNSRQARGGKQAPVKKQASNNASKNVSKQASKNASRNAANERNAPSRKQAASTNKPSKRSSNAANTNKPNKRNVNAANLKNQFSVKGNENKRVRYAAN